MSAPGVPAYQWLARVRAGHRGSSVELMLACDRAAPSTVLRDLKLDDAVASHLLFHDNCPDETVVSIAAWAPMHARIHYASALLNQQQTRPAALFSTLAGRDHGSHAADVVTLMLAHPSCPTELIAEYTHDARYSKTIASNPSCPTGILRGYTGSLSLALLVAKNPSCPADLLARFKNRRTKNHGQYQGMLVSNPAIDGDWLRSVYNQNVGLACLAHANPACPLDLHDTAIQHGSGTHCKNAATNPTLPADMLDRLAQHADLDVVTAVAGNPNTAPETLQMLSERFERRAPTGFFEKLGTNPNTPTRAVERLSRRDAR